MAPEAATSLLVGQAVADILHDYTGNDAATVGLAIATAITLQVSRPVPSNTKKAKPLLIQAGVIEFFLGFFRLGFIDVVLSRALLRGFITAVAVVIMVYVYFPMIFLSNTY